MCVCVCIILQLIDTVQHINFTLNMEKALVASTELCLTVNYNLVLIRSLNN